MPTNFHHGIRVTEANDGTRPLRVVNTAVIGLLSTGATADATYFPVDTPVLVTNIQMAISKAGTDTKLKAALQAIAEITNPVMVVVRAEEGEDAEETETNLVGGVVAGKRTGMQALLDAQSQLGVKPRIFGAPGLDTEAVTTALATLAAKLHGFVYASCDAADTVAEALTYRATFSQRELMLIYPDFSKGGGDQVARALGLRAWLDENVGWHKTLSNVAVPNVTGLSQGITFDLQDSENDAGVLNAGDVTTLIRQNGFRFWGNRTCSDDPLFAFESATRTGQVLRDTVAEGLLWAMDKPLTPSLAKDILETINALFRSLKNGGYIIGATAWLDPAKNPPENLAAGKLAIDYDYTPCAPLEQLDLQQSITDTYYQDFATGLAA
jgi:uncharacterized protein